ncbi:MAG: anhydro-N-acetylmuramic acid kinase [Candidatus Rifleibacteriota bacterium]
MPEKNSSNSIKILGMMSGTSGDGIDGALVEFDSEGSYKLLWHDSMIFHEKERKRLRDLMINATSSDVVLGHAYVAELYVEACKTFLSENRKKPDYIAAHGQTILHLPQPMDWDGRILRGSLQLLNGSVLANKSGFPVICNFREADMAVGGQGAPLVPYADFIFFGQNMPSDRIILNIGGIANITVLKKIDRSSEILTAYDTGPGNMMMDAYCEHISAGAKRFDANGEMAASGRVVEAIVSEILSDKYFNELPPKSTGREKFGIFRLNELLATVARNCDECDVMASLLEITVLSIAQAVTIECQRLKPPVELIVAGGGALNRQLLKRLQIKLGDLVSVLTSEKVGIPVMARESMAFAALGAAFVRGEAGNVPCATGAAQKVILGQLHPVPVNQ